MTSRKTFAVLLDEILGRANLRRVDLAQKLDVTKQAVGNWLRDEHPSPKLMARLLVVLDAYMSPDTRQILLAAYARETGALPAKSVIWAAK